MSENTELMTVQQDLYVAPVVGIEDAKTKFEQVREYTAKCLTKDIDYGVISGVSKPTLLKPGAEKIGSLFGLSPRFECVDKVLNFTGAGNPDNEPFFYFEYRCNLYKGDQFVASCDGSCNSWEKKYRYRKGGMLCPDCGKPTVKISKYGGYYCDAKAGGCNHKFQANDSRIIKQSGGDLKNFDTAEQVNTFQKMAQKRAYVGAILIACNLSEYYTQDVEDMDLHETEIVEGNYQQIPPEQAQPKKQFDEISFLRDWNEKVSVVAGDTQITLPEISIEMAWDIDTKNSDGTVVKMGKRGVGELAGMWKAYKNRLSDPNVNRDDVLMRLSAVNKILTAKAQAQAAFDIQQ